MLFILAERFGRTVAELESTLSVDEFFEWIAWERIRGERASSL